MKAHAKTVTTLIIELDEGEAQILYDGIAGVPLQTHDDGRFSLKREFLDILCDVAGAQDATTRGLKAKPFQMPMSPSPDQERLPE